MNFKSVIAALLAFSALAACKPNPDKLFTEASTAFAEERYEQAIPIYEQLLADQFSNPNLYAKLGISYAYTGAYEKCTEFIQRAFESKVDYFELYEMITFCYERQKKDTEAMTWYKNGIEKYPDRYEFKNSAALLAFRSKNPQLALDWFGELADKNPKNVDWNYNAGTVSENLEKYDMAERYYRRVLEQKPKYANASFGLGSIFEKQNQLDIAKGYYEKTLKIDPDHLSALLNLAQLEQKTEPKQALTHWKQYLALAEKRKQPQKFLDQAKKQIKLLEGGTK